MKANKTALALCATAIVVMGVAVLGRLSWPTVVQASAASNSRAGHGSVQVSAVDPGDSDIASSFQVAIYENLIQELDKTKQFQQVFRYGDHRAIAAPTLLVLKTTVEKYSAGSETRRAVTTVSGATRLTVRSQLCTREGKVVLERTVNGNVRFFGSNLRVTHNLAHNIAETIANSNWSASEEPAAKLTGQPRIVVGNAKLAGLE